MAHARIGRALTGSALLAATLMVAGPRPAGASAARPDGAAAARPDGSTLAYMAPSPGSAQNPCFSPTGSSLAFTKFAESYNTGDAQVDTVSASGGTATVLFGPTGQQSVNLPGACWNRVNGLVTFTSDYNANLGDEIWTKSPSGTPTQITSHTTSDGYAEPTFSPNGQWIVFEDDLSVTDAANQRASIEVVAANGSGRRIIVNGPATNTNNREPNWSPDGTRILFQRQVPGGQFDLYTIDPAGSASPTLVSSLPGDSTDASWSPDGQRIVYSSSYNPQDPTTPLAHANLLAIDAGGGVPVRVTNQPYYDGAPSWSPDGRTIVFESGVSGDDGAPGTSLWKIAAPPLSRPPTVVAGYVHADQPTAATSYTPGLVHQYNSTGTANTVARVAAGTYQVRFPNLGLTTGGTVDVTAYGPTPGLNCTSAGFAASAGAEYVNVRCSGPTGALVDGAFTAGYTRATGTAAVSFAYVWANNPSVASYTPSATYQYNSAGVPNTVTRSSLGHYAVSLPHQGGSGGTVKVTPTGSTQAACQVLSWSAHVPTTENVNVTCATSAGSAVDAPFTLTFAGSRDLLGDPWRSTAYALANQPTTASYTPASQYSVGAPVTILRLGAGYYRINLGSAYVGSGGDVQLSPYGAATAATCSVLGWGATGYAQTIDVQCFSDAGAPTDEPFTIQYRG